MKKLTAMLAAWRGASWRAVRRQRAGAAQHRLHASLVGVQHLLAGGEEGLRRRLRQDPGELPDDLHADRRLDRAAGRQHAGRACRQAGRADHLDRRQQRLRRGHQGARATPASSSSPSMSTTPKAPRAMPGRPSSARASFRPAIRSARRMSEDFPAEGPIKVLVGVSAPGQNWSEQPRRRRHEVPGGVQGGAIPTARCRVERIDSGTDLAVTSDRVGAYLNAHPDTTAYFDTGFWHAGVARVLADRGVEPGKVLLGGFDLVPEVLQQMKKPATSRCRSTSSLTCRASCR